MDIVKIAREVHEAGYEDSHENLKRMSAREKDQTHTEYEAQRTFPHTEKALKEFAAQVWAEGYEAYGQAMVGEHDGQNPYEEV